MVAINKQNGKPYDVIKVVNMVHEIGSDTKIEYGKTIILYNAERRYQFKADRNDYIIVDSWDKVNVE